MVKSIGSTNINTYQHNTQKRRQNSLNFKKIIPLAGIGVTENLNKETPQLSKWVKTIDGKVIDSTIRDLRRALFLKDAKAEKADSQIYRYNYWVRKNFEDNVKDYPNYTKPHLYEINQKNKIILHFDIQNNQSYLLTGNEANKKYLAGQKYGIATNEEIKRIKQEAHQKTNNKEDAEIFIKNAKSRSPIIQKAQAKYHQTISNIFKNEKVNESHLKIYAYKKNPKKSDAMKIVGVRFINPEEGTK